MPRQHAVDEVRDDSVLLQTRLDEIASGGGRVISIIWQPERKIEQPGNYIMPETARSSGYVVVSE